MCKNAIQSVSCSLLFLVWASSVFYTKGGHAGIGLYLQKCSQQALERDFSSTPFSTWDCTWRPASSFGLASTRQTGIFWCNSTWRLGGLSIRCTRRDWDNQIGSALRGESKKEGNLTGVNHLFGRCQEGRARLSSEVCSDTEAVNTGCNEHHSYIAVWKLRSATLTCLHIVP